MTTITKQSLPIYGGNAAIHGLNITFLAMTLSAVLLVLFAFFSGKSTLDTATELK
ncbi:hypothetical protein P7D31_10505 [Enterococcus dongliensis]|nr:hypothetical protein [Enterococcus dongliensis]MDT2671916.1 hypothetical protein [Enterococcus dongliensis]